MKGLALHAHHLLKRMDDLDEVGIGTHDRFITDASKSAEKLRAKAEKAGILGKQT